MPESVSYLTYIPRVIFHLLPLSKIRQMNRPPSFSRKLRWPTCLCKTEGRGGSVESGARLRLINKLFHFDVFRVASFILLIREDNVILWNIKDRQK